MKLNEVTEILNSLPIGRSQFEFKNFFIDAYPSSARCIAAALIELENLHISKIDNLDKQKKKTTSTADKIRINRQIKIIDNQISQLETFFATINTVDIPTSNEYEQQERNYWINILGKQAAIELLTSDRINQTTMNQMISLPQPDFLESVKICIDSIKLIKNTTDHLEMK
jgi:hypothetical protein